MSPSGSDWPPPRLQTQVARVSPHELHFRGRSVSELFGSTLWELLLDSLGAVRPSATQQQVLDALATCALAADPRLWPLKLAQLAACHGSVSAGLSASYLACEHSPMSYWAAERAALFLRRLHDELGSTGVPPETILGRALQERSPPGFGVYKRALDARVQLLREWLPKLHHRPGPMERLLTRVEPLVWEQHATRLHYNGLLAATLSDFGLQPAQVGVVAGFVSALPCVLPNAFESSQRGPNCLRQVPNDSVVYSGRAPRTSNRSRAASR